jgi:F-box-like
MSLPSVLTPAAWHTIPSPEENRQTKKSILQLEIQLEQEITSDEKTKLRIAKLKEELEQRRAWIAPIRKIPFEILSEIFKMCARLEQLAPVTIAAVSQQWRSIILATPRAWSYIFPSDFKTKATGIELPTRLLPTFLERSDPCLLHVALPWRRHCCHCDECELSDYETDCTCPSISTIFEHARRIECLVVSYKWIKKRGPFPNLTNLILTGDDTDGYSSTLDLSKFPRLYKLDIGNAPGVNYRIDLSKVENHQLRHLSISVDYQDTWVKILNFFADVLETLEFTGNPEEDLVSYTRKFEFPNLERLYVIDISTCESVLEIIAPNLAYYRYSSEQGNLRIVHRGGTNRLVQLRTDFILPWHEYGHLRVLQLDLPPDSDERMLDQLEQDSDICPHLQSMQLFTPPEDLDEAQLGVHVEQGRKVLSSRKEKVNSGIKHLTIENKNIFEGFLPEVSSPSTESMRAG